MFIKQQSLINIHEVLESGRLTAPCTNMTRRAGGQGLAGSPLRLTNIKPDLAVMTSVEKRCPRNHFVHIFVNK